MIPWRICARCIPSSVTTLRVRVWHRDGFRAIGGAGMAVGSKGKLDGKVAIVTGASSGIGAASARLFAEAGARVVVGYNRGVDRANAVVAELAGAGHKAMHLPLEDTAQIRKVAIAVEAEFGRAHILVNSPVL